MGMIVDPITDGIVLDHIKAGLGMQLYKILRLNELPCAVAMIMNADSRKMGHKDIIKISAVIDLDLDVIGYVDPDITINIIQNGRVVKRTNLEPPERVVDVIRCRNPRCITSTEQELPQIFRLTDRERRVYRCLYCDSRAKSAE